MGRCIIAVIAGMITAVVVIFRFEAISGAVYPPPPGTDFNDPKAVAAFVANAPPSAIALVLVGYIAASFVGGLVAAAIASRARPTHALIVGGIVLTASIINLAMIHHPLWFVIVNLLAPLPAAYLAGRLLTRQPTAPAVA